MSGLKVTMIDTSGVERSFDDVEEGVNLMELGKRHGVAGIMGDCGGCCACATCHVYVDTAWWGKVGEPDDIELAMLDMVADVQKETSRLGCQVKMRSDLDGLVVTVAPAAGY